MATIKPTVTYAPNGMANGALVEWLNVSENDTCAPFEGLDFADRTVQIDGTFGAGGTVKLQGSNDGASYFDLTDPQGNAISKTTAGLEVIEEGPRYAKPVISAGTGVSANIRVWARRAR